VRILLGTIPRLRIDCFSPLLTLLAAQDLRLYEQRDGCSSTDAAEAEAGLGKAAAGCISFFWPPPLPPLPLRQASLRGPELRELM